MKKLIPYIVAYLIVTSGIAIYSHFARHSPYPPNSVTVITTLSHDELAAKLQQVGLTEAQHLATMTVSSTSVASLVYNFGFYAVIFTAFAGLAFLFHRVVCANCKSHDVAA